MMQPWRASALVICTGLLIGVIACAPKNSDPAQTIAAQQTLQQADVFVLDVRTGVEFSSGHLPGAVHIPVSELEARQQELPVARDAPILVYCRSGGRSARAKALLEQAGYTAVTDGGALKSLQSQTLTK